MQDSINIVGLDRNAQPDIETLRGLSIVGSPNADSPVSSQHLNHLEIISTITTNSKETEKSLTQSDGAPKTLSFGSDPRKHLDGRIFINRQYSQESTLESLPDEARDVLQRQPDYETLTAVLQYLKDGIDGKHAFNIFSPSPKASQIINVLVTVTVIDHWDNLQSSRVKNTGRLQLLLLSSLKSLAGIGALLMQIKELGNPLNQKKRDEPLLLMISVLKAVLGDNNILTQFTFDAFKIYKTEAQRKVFWQEATSIFAGSRILNTVSQALSHIKASDSSVESIKWLGDGKFYSRWLAEIISVTATDLDTSISERWILVSQVMKRGLILGYHDAFVSELSTIMLFGERPAWKSLFHLLNGLSLYERRKVYDSILRDLVKRYLSSEPFHGGQRQDESKSDPAIGGVAATITKLAEQDPVIEDLVTQNLVSPSEQYAILGLDTRRAFVTSLDGHQGKLCLVLEKCLERLSDKQQIKHSPILLQEAVAQTMLLVVAHLNRIDHESVQKTSKSGAFLNVVSNRLGASIPRARFLGMVIGVAVSRLVDQPDKVMDFGVEEMKSEEAQAWLSIIDIRDTVTTMKALQSLVPRGPQRIIGAKSSMQKTLQRYPNSLAPIKAADSRMIEEVVEKADENGEFIPYSKPDEDPSDSEDDPTLIDRSKPSAPVYIIDLINQLQLNDKPEVTELALKTAPSLIRRKAGFGRELSDNIYAVASALVNLREGVSKREMQQLRLEALIACLVSKAEVIGPWIASMYFEGDFSFVQRAALLTTVGLGARELSGHNDGPNISYNGPSFPSQRLPPHLESIYSPMDQVIREIEHSSLQPMALAAADKLSGPDILKVRTFSSRMEVEKRNAQKSKERSRRIPKHLHKLLAESIYLPLCCRMTLILSSSSSNSNLSSRSTIFEPHVLRLFLQTLVIVITCLGPNAVQLPSVTRETLLLLMSWHAIPQLSTDPVVLPVLLQLLLTTLNLNTEASLTAEEQLVTEFGPMVAELVTWANGVGEIVTVPVAEREGMDGMPWTVIAAGIQLKWHGIGRKYQGRMLGLMGGDLDTF